jgi:hypothetical protein
MNQKKDAPPDQTRTRSNAAKQNVLSARRHEQDGWPKGTATMGRRPDAVVVRKVKGAVPSIESG